MFLTNDKEIIGSTIITKIEIDIQIFLQSIIVNKKIVSKGRINSAKERPSHVALKALPLVFSKNLDIVVLAVCDISPCPESLIKKIEKKRKINDEILENKKQEIASNTTTYDANFKMFTLSIFLPIQTNIKLLNNVADA